MADQGMAPLPILRLLGALLALAAAPGLAGCGASVGDSVPTWAGGLPPATPARASAPPPYPDVDDIPPPRQVELISQPEQAEIEAELMAIRRKANAQAEALRKEQSGGDR